LSSASTSSRTTAPAISLNHVVAAFDCEFTVNEWAELQGIPASTIASRLRLGWEPERALVDPVKCPATHTAHGVTFTLREWSELTGLALKTLQTRVRTVRACRSHAWTPERIVDEPQFRTNKQQAPKYEVAPGAPGSISWDIEPWATDPAVRAFVASNPEGATVERVAAAIGLRDSQLRAAQDSALAKIRRLALTGDVDALRFLAGCAGDVDEAELVDDLAERYPRENAAALETMRRREQADAEARDALLAAELVSLDELDSDPANDNDDGGLAEELEQLGYASSWA
jgi:hypothetical protein